MLSVFSFRTERQISATHMLDFPGLRYGSRDIYNRRQDLEIGRSTNLFHVIHAVLQTDDQSTGREQGGQLSGGGGVVGGLHAKQNNLCCGSRGHFRGCLAAHVLLKLQRIQKETVSIYGLNEGWAADHGHRRSVPRQQTAEISSDGARSNYGDTRPVFLLCHGM